MKASRLVGVCGVTALGVLAIAYTGKWEGLRLVAYQDVVRVWTVCYGETKGIKPGMRFTKEECDLMFIGSLTRHEAGMRDCLKLPDVIPGKSYVAYLDLAYNVGVGAFCRSTVRIKANAGDYRGACNAMSAFIKGGRPKRTIKGLVNRRVDLLKFCLEGVKEAA